MTANVPGARGAIERALALRDDDRDSVLLAAEILAREGRAEEAAAARARAAHLPQGDWSERAVLR